jgi:hypothetical protein
VDTKEIDFYLRKYDNFIKKQVSNKIKPQQHQIFQIEDIVQETRILLFKLIQERFDPSIASIDAFILAHTPYSVYKVITYLARNLYYTGKYEDGEGRKAPRTGTKKVDDNAIRISFADFSPSIPQDTSLELAYPLHYIIISGTYIPYEFIDKVRGLTSIKDAFADGGTEKEIIESIDVEIIKKEIRKRLNDSQTKIFDLLVAEGENTSFTQGRISKTRNLSTTEISERIGYSKPGAVNKEIKEIRNIVSQVLKELEV